MKIKIGSKTRKNETSAIFKIFLFWLGLSFLIQILGFLDTKSLRDLITIVGEIIFLVYFIVILKLKDTINPFLDRLNISGIHKFISIGVISSLAGEVLYYFSIKPSFSIIIFLIRPLVWYIGWYFLWWRLLMKYDYSNEELFFWAGLNGYLVEGIVLRQFQLIFSPMALIVFPLIVFIYGVIFTVPVILAREEINQLGQFMKVNAGKKYLSSFIPLTAWVPGLVWLFLIERIFSIN